MSGPLRLVAERLGPYGSLWAYPDNLEETSDVQEDSHGDGPGINPWGIDPRARRARILQETQETIGNTRFAENLRRDRVEPQGWVGSGMGRVA